MKFIIIISLVVIFMSCNESVEPVYYYEVKRLGKVQERFKIIKGKDSLNYFFQNYYYDFDLDGEYDDTHNFVIDSMINDTLSHRGKVFFINKKRGDCWDYPEGRYFVERIFTPRSYCVKAILCDTIINNIHIQRGAVYSVKEEELDYDFEICVDYDRRLFIYFFNNGYLDKELFYEEKLIKIENENN